MNKPSCGLSRCSCCRSCSVRHASVGFYASGSRLFSAAGFSWLQEDDSDGVQVERVRPSRVCASPVADFDVCSYRSLGISLTGVFPEHFSQDVISPDALFRMSYALHSLGLFSAALLVIIPFSWLLRNAVAMRAIRLRVVGMRALVFLAVLLLSVIYLSYHERPDVIDQCALLSQAEHCEAWGHLDAAQCALLAGMDGARVHDYACGWINHTLTPDERLLLPADFVNFHDGKCVRERCPLFRYARSTALEYACLLLTAFYIGYYSVPDALALSRADTHAEAVDSLLNDGMIERRIRPSDEDPVGFGERSSCAHLELTAELTAMIWLCVWQDAKAAHYDLLGSFKVNSRIALHAQLLARDSVNIMTPDDDFTSTDCLSLASGFTWAQNQSRLGKWQDRRCPQSAECRRPSGVST
eukprot:3473571-Pleurochrysis_carterae.AAC.1